MREGRCQVENTYIRHSLMPVEVFGLPVSRRSGIGPKTGRVATPGLEEGEIAR